MCVLIFYLFKPFQGPTVYVFVFLNLLFYFNVSYQTEKQKELSFNKLNGGVLCRQLGRYVVLCSRTRFVKSLSQSTT